MKKCSQFETKSILIGILDYFDTICDKYNLEYSLYAGTMLGAARHKGFIPWDDDLDVVMPWEDYQKFIEISKQIDNKHYSIRYLENDSTDFFFPFIKIEDVRTVAVYKKSFESGGAFLDVFPLVHVPDDISVRSKYFSKLYKLHFLLAEGYTKLGKNLLKGIYKPFLKKLRKRNGLKILQTLEELDKKYSSSNLMSEAGWSDNKEKEILPKSSYSNLILIEFEGKKYKCFQDYEKILSKQYGDWKKFPPIKERVPHHGYELYKK